MIERIEQTTEPLRELTDELIAYAPKAALFLAVIIVGLVLSFLARGLTRWAVKRSGLEALGERAGVAKLLYAIGARDGLAQVLGTLVWVAGLLLTFAAAAELIGLTAVASAVGIVMAFLPRLLAAGLVLLVGISAATLVRNLVQRVGKSGSLESPKLVGTVVYYIIITISVVMAADQAGLETQLVRQLVVVAVGICLAAIGLAFSLGSRSVFRNLVAGHYLQRAVRPGDEVRLGEVHGTLLRYAGVSAVVRTGAGQVLVPCQAVLDGLIEVTPVAAEATTTDDEADGDSDEPSAFAPPPT